VDFSKGEIKELRKEKKLWKL